MSRLLITVDRITAGEPMRTTRTFVDTADIDPGMRLVAEAALDGVLRVLVDDLHMTRGDAAALVLCLSVEQQADEEAYQRVAAERGLLAL